MPNACLSRKSLFLLFQINVTIIILSKSIFQNRILKYLVFILQGNNNMFSYLGAHVLSGSDVCFFGIC